MGRRILFLTLCAAMLLATGFSTGGEAYAKQEVTAEGKDYTAILDLDRWLFDFHQDRFPGEFGEEYAAFMEILDETFGITTWEQLELSAKTQGKRVELESVVEFTGDPDGDSLSALFTHWEPGRSITPSSMSRENLLGLYSLGNPMGALEAKMEWLVNSNSLARILKALPIEDEFPPIHMLWPLSKMTLKGYWYTAREEVYPKFGDALTIALYTNEDFVGWEESYNAETIMEALPAKFIIAIDLGEEGLVEQLNEALEDYIYPIEQILYPYSSSSRYRYRSNNDYRPSHGNDEDMITLNSKKILGQEINYLSLGEDFDLAWMEYDNVLFISDLATIENIDAYYDSGNRSDAPDRFNDYMYLDFDNIIATFVSPVEDEINEELELMSDYSESLAPDYGKRIARKLTGGRLGVLELYDIFDETKVTSKVTMTEDIGDVLLLGFEFLEVMKDEGVGFLECPISPYAEVNPARYPGLGKQEIYLPYPAAIYGGKD